MNLKSGLEEILQKMDTAACAFIMDADGLVVEKAEAEGIDDLENAFVIFMQGFRSISNSASEMKLGKVRELCVTTSDYRFIFLRINGEYFLILAITEKGYLGEGIYRIRQAADKMAGDFAP